MPLYEYECRTCRHRFERIQQYSDPPVRKCPECKKGKVDKLPSAPAVQFKGSGWYVTDYARKGTSSALPDQGGGSGDKEGKEGKEAGKEGGGKKDAGKEGGGKKDAGKESSSARRDASRKAGRKD